MSDDKTVYVTVGESQMRGLWCETCNLPSRVMYPMLAMTEDGFSPLGHCSACTECDE